MTQNTAKRATRTPEQAIDQFIRGLLLVDANILAASLGETQTGEQILAQTWGVLTPYIDRREPSDLNEYSWKVIDVKTSGSQGTARVEFKAPNVGAQVARMRELRGARFNAEGQLLGYDPSNQLSMEQALEMARRDPNILPVVYLVPVGVRLRDGKKPDYWSVDPNNKLTRALFDVVRDGDSLASNAQYLVRP
ncbi:hypothetical protein [Deinococcus multiflagellatus]|uniref:Restriction endonuclease n=1 Tax=Deinococcus multiflagellatus TaxID=1656887 RepID=A0ABW1ZPJ4_9DEIO